MKRYRWLQLVCAAACISWAVQFPVCAADKADMPVEKKMADTASASASKMVDPAFSVPKVNNPIPDEVVNGMKIVEEKGRWLVSDKALEQYGIYRADEKEGTYWFRLPPASDGSSPWLNDYVALRLPGRDVRGGQRTINIRHVRRPLGIGYVLGETQNELYPPRKPTRVAPMLQQVKPDTTAPAAVQKQGKMGLVLFWDPKMDEEAPLPALQTAQPVMSPCAFRLSDTGVLLRNPDFDMLAETYASKGYAMWPLVDNNFDPDLTHRILQDERLQEQLIQELIGYALLYEFKGYNLDFENINYADRDGLTRFVAAVSKACHAYGLQVSMDVTPLSDSPNWSLVYDRQALASSLDYLMVMAYDQYGRTSPVAGPVASLPWVEKAVQDMVPLVGAHKLILGMPLYMRLWYESADGKELPADLNLWPPLAETKKKTAPAANPAAPVPDTDRAATGSKADLPDGNSKRTKAPRKPKLFVRTLSMADSEAVREKYKSYVKWDDALHLYVLDVPLETGRVKIWFEDEQSLKAKAELVKTYQLGGVSLWRKGFESPQFWDNFAKHELT